ncbi:SulP family inorganic anion transporter [Leisingera methylohalidivorans]|uniref:Sulfate transporter n=1 Tax=Leisingera methylohalidivorans DSM 14336 TaxID=999552 RepID=V9VXV4_9RHOB|nr:SulP family inorganic anion transporter [Leisingera methylohalidivorans]AHD03571.1 sulfate transporter [Leisingera methylohalidivorans DSM 14336]
MSAATEILGRLVPVRPWMTAVDGQSLRADAMAGLTGATIVLPQGIAFAVIAGLPPEYGLFTAMIVPLVAAIWGSSMIMVSGPTTAISAVLFATLAPLAPVGTPEYVTLALVLTLLVGAMQLAAGLSGLGEVIAFISHSVIVGFTGAAAVLIFVSQLGPALGLGASEGSVLPRLLALADRRDMIEPAAMLIAAVTLGTILLMTRLDKRLPAYILALLAGSVAGALLDAAGRGVAHFAPLGAVSPSFAVPQLQADSLAALLPGAAAVAFVGLLEAISIGKSFAVARKERFDSNQEIVGQGMSNLVGSFFQCYAGSGSFTRSGLNADSGAKTPLSAILAAGFLLLMLWLVSPLVARVPVPAVSAIILYVALKLIDHREIRHIVTTSRSETVILLVTFVTGVVSELDFAILAGVVASLVVFLSQSARPLVAVGAPAGVGGRRVFLNAHHYGLPQCPQISMTRLEGPLFFGSIDHVERRFRQLDAQDGDKTRIFNLRGVGRIDMSGGQFVLDEVRRARAQGHDLHLIAKHPDILRTLERLHCGDVLGPDHIHGTKAAAIDAAVAAAQDDICARCRLRVFHECARKPGAPADESGPQTAGLTP